MMTIRLDEATANRLRKQAEQNGIADVNAFAVALLNDSLTENTADETLTPVEQEAMDEAIRVGLEAAEAGRVKPIEQVIAEAEARFRSASRVN